MALEKENYRTIRIKSGDELAIELDDMQAERDDYKERYNHQCELKYALQEREAKLEEALQWCSGSEDFALGGKARIGWEKLCAPLLKRDDSLALEGVKR